MPDSSSSQELGGALEKLRLKLLDLTGRNRLINFRHTAGKALQFSEGQPGAIYRKLLEGTVSITGLPEPPRRDWIERNGRKMRPEPLEWARKQGIPTAYDLPRQVGGNGSSALLRALLYPDDLAKHCRKLEREAHLAIEETGANMLFLVLGFLELPDQQQSDRTFLAPLVSVPVALSRAESNGQQRFWLQHTGDDVAENLSLREKLRQDYEVVLPDLGDDEDLDVEEYLRSVARVVATRPGFAVRRRVSLCLLSFSNMLLFRDLEPKHWAAGASNGLVDHPIVRQVFSGGSPDGEGGAHGAPAYGDGEEHPVEADPGAQIPLVFDADSSQHNALVDALALRRNLVIEGPPGTGKSQTITNLIAACIAAGKSVLFVSEKMAALEVVRTRLARAHLDPFVLELHSNKTSKKQVIEAVERRTRYRSTAADGLPFKHRQLEERRRALQRYVELLNQPGANGLGLTLHSAMWLAERHRLRLGPEAARLTQVKVDDATSLSPDELARRVVALEHLGRQLEAIGGQVGPEAPFHGFRPAPITPEVEQRIARILEGAEGWLAGFQEAAHRYGALLPAGPRGATREDLEGWAAVLDALVSHVDERWPLELVPRLFESDATGVASRRELEALAEQVARYRSLASSVDRGLLRESAADAARLAGLREVAARASDAGVTLGSAREIRDRLEMLVRARGRIADGLEHVRVFCLDAQLTLPATRAVNEGLYALVSLVDGAPIDALRVQCGKLADPSALRVLESLAGALREWTAAREELERDLYLDLLPSEQELTDAVKTLREGAAWYRVFQSSWRKAIRLHKRLSRVKARKPVAERLRQLEELLRLDRLGVAWRKHEAWTSVLGSPAPDEPFPLDEHLAVARWNVAVASAQEELGARLFEPAAVDPEALRALRRRLSPLRTGSTKVKEGLAALDAVVGEVANQAPDADLGPSLRKVDALVTSLEPHAEWLATEVPSHARFEDALEGCVAAVERVKVREKVLDNVVLRQLLGAAFAGADTDVERLLDLHAFVRGFEQLELPAPVRAFLRSGHPVERARILRQIARELSEGLAHCSAYTAALVPYGELELEAWSGTTPEKDLPGFAAGFRARCERARGAVEALVPWSQYLSRRREAEELGLGAFVAMLERRELAPHEGGDAYSYCVHSSIVHDAFARHPELGMFSGLKHGRVRDEFQRLDREVIALRGLAIAAQSKSRANPPDGRNGARVAEKTEMALIEYLLPQQRPRVPVRALLRRAGKAVQALKPCFMMGPQSVAQFLDPAGLRFDVIIMDEASQLRPEEALGAVARGRQLVVVGDPKQLPPTSFFSRATATDGDEAQFATDDAESILDVCSAHFRPLRALRWHYRSQHHSLIAFSNHNFYNKNLVIFPSPYGQSDRLGVKAVYLADAVYEDQVNLVEARRVVDAIVEHAERRPDASLGVVTLNIKQRDVIAELLDERVRRSEGAERFRQHWLEKGHPLFVKNLENVQGDERDAIIISTTFGRPPGAGAVRQNFGPISRSGGWRRLNVLFTRARQSVTVFTSLRPDDIVVDNGTPAGTRALRDYLEYARTGQLATAEDTGIEPESEFEAAVIGVLKARGFEVTPQLGVTGYRVDIAVKHPDYPGAYLAAIECDGATYHSARSVRDRDRIRQEILESLGWRGRIWRIWSTDWFRSPRAEIEKLLGFLNDLRTTWRPDHSPLSTWIEEGGAIPEGRPDAARDAASAREVVQQVLVGPDDDLEVEVGDLVRYVDIAHPDDVLTVRIVGHVPAVRDGLIGSAAPLAQALLGAVVGDEVPFHVPGGVRKTLCIKEIRRTAAGDQVGRRELGVNAG
ncbi:MULTISPECIES: DUF4011 domain-containing protein [unclassified Anaeromyxobacter]|uniref:DUF4011 domain-containing protein n=1 Tax=unclassified Anaeromyxobacter TaxID=2620896 RepID=UPI001F5AEC59|nr:MULTISPECIES: DUF4011 domain-containing protein [unclassified Anaeromyxobacter]